MEFAHKNHEKQNLLAITEFNNKNNIRRIIIKGE